MATSWIVEALTTAVTSTDTKTAYLANDKYFDIQDSTDATAPIFKILNDADNTDGNADYWSMQLFGHDGQSAKFYITADRGDAAIDSWLWEIAEDGIMYWKLRTSGTGPSVEDDTYENRLSLVSNNAAATTLSVIADEAQDAIIKLVSDESTDSGDEWLIKHEADDNTLAIQTDKSGSAVSQITLTPHATVASSTTAIAGNLTVAGNTTLTGDIAVNGDDITCDGNLNVDVVGDITLDADGGNIYLKDGGTTYMDIQVDGSNDTIAVTGDLTLDISGDMTIDADGGDFYIKDAGVQMMRISHQASGVAMGREAGDAFGTSDLKSIAIGKEALTAEDGAIGNIAIGHQAMKASNADAAAKNIAIGFEAMEHCTAPGENNIAIGQLALSHASFTGDRNVAIGFNSLDNTQTATVDNIAIGYNALGTGNVSATGKCVAIGRAALLNNTEHSNVAIGYYAGKENTSGTNLTAVGYDSLSSNTSGLYNTALGHQACKSNEVGDHNTAVGYKALTSYVGDEGSSLNVAVGSQAGLYVTTATRSTFVGVNAGMGSSGNGLTGVGNTCIGNGAGQLLQTNAAGNTLMGVYSGDAITTGDYNVAIGQSALSAAQDVDNCVIIGKSAGAANMTADADATVAIGVESLEANTVGQYNVGVGFRTLEACVSSDSNTALGYQALKTMNVADTATANTAMGNNAGMSVTTGINNTYMGHNAGNGGTDGNSNTGVGVGALSEDHGNYNTACGKGTLSACLSNNNTAVGYQALSSLTLGTNNVALGYQALDIEVEGGSCVAIGSGALGAQVNTGTSSNTAIHNVAIGTSAGASVTTGTQNTVIGTYAGGTITTTGNTVAVGYHAGRFLTSGSCTVLGTEAAKNALDPGTITALGYRAGRGATNTTYTVATCDTTLGSATVNCDSADIYAGDVVTGTGLDAGVSYYVASITNGTEGDSVTRFELNVGTSVTAQTDTTLTFNPAISGNYNTIVGTNAGLNLRGECVGNTLLGREAGHQMTYGYDNVFIGNEAAQKATSNTYQNVVIGRQAGNELTTGYSNTFVGNQAGNTLTTGNACVAIGRNSDVTAGGVNQIAIGHTTATDGDNKGRWGNSSVTTNNIQTDWTVDSDRRIKDNIEDSSLGLSFINSLKSRTFTKIHPADYPESIRERRYKSGGANYDDKENKIIRDKFDDEKVWNGLIAQEVKESMDSFGVDFSGWDEEVNGKQGVTYSTLVMPLIKAVQELSAQVEELKNKLGE